MAGVVRRILNGETDMDALHEGLDREEAYIIHNILAQLSGTGVPPVSGGPPTRPTFAAEEGLTLVQLPALVQRALAGDAALGAQLFPAMEQAAGDPAAPPELRALFRVLAHLLIGERDVDVSGLPPELAAAVQRLKAEG